MIQTIAQGMLYVYALGMIPYLYLALKGLQSVPNKVDSAATNVIGSVVAVLVVLLTWPVLFVRAVSVYLKNRNRVITRKVR